MADLPWIVAEDLRFCLSMRKKVKILVLNVSGGEKITCIRAELGNSWIGPLSTLVWRPCSNSLVWLMKGKSYLPPVAAWETCAAHHRHRYGPTHLQFLLFFLYFYFIFCFVFVFVFCHLILKTIHFKKCLDLKNIQIQKLTN